MSFKSTVKGLGSDMVRVSDMRRMRLWVKSGSAVCGSETGKKQEKKREVSRFLPGYDITDETWYNGYNAGARESDY